MRNLSFPLLHVLHNNDSFVFTVSLLLLCLSFDLAKNTVMRFVLLIRAYQLLCYRSVYLGI